MQEFLQTVLNKTKIIIYLLSCCFFSVAAQNISDVAIKMSVQPTTMYPGQRGTLFFEISNMGGVPVYITGGNMETLQANGNLEYETIVFDYDSLTGGTRPVSCHFDYSIVPLSYQIILLVFELEANTTERCKIDFTVPEDTTAEFVTFGFSINHLNRTNYTDPNPNNNTASIRINIQPRTTSVPTLNLWGLLVLVLGLLLLVKYRRKILF